MEVGKAEITGALPCMAGSDKVHISLAVETRARRPLYKHLSYFCLITEFFFINTSLPSDTDGCLKYREQYEGN